MAKIETINEKKIQNPELKKLLAEVKENKTEENQEALFQQLLKASLLAPIILDVKPVTLANGKKRLPKTAGVKFLMLNTKDGKQFLPLFTDIEQAHRMKQLPENVQFTVRRLSNYKQMLQMQPNTSGLVINPMDANLVLPRKLALLLADGKTPKTMAQKAASPLSGQVTFREPQLYPTALANAVYDACAQLPGVSRLWLKQAVSSEGGQGIALIVEQDKKDAKAARQILEAGQAAAPKTQIIVMDWSQDLQDKVLKDAVPLYDRELEI